MKILKNRFLLIAARALDYRIGTTDSERPDLPVLRREEALVAFLVKFLIVALNLLTCGFVIASVIRHW